MNPKDVSLDTPGKLTGLIAAPFTAFGPQGELNLELIGNQARQLVAGGVSGAFICGTTGEGFSLTTEERMQIAERWVAVAPPQLKVIVHVGHNCLGDSVKLAAHAEKIGAHAIANIAPSFFRPASVEQLVEFCVPVAAAAPMLPYFYYHIPIMTGVNFSMLDFLRIASRRIPNLAGIKSTDENLMNYAQCLEYEGGRFNILFGRDEILLPALTMGATGAVGSTYNYMAPIYLKIMEAFRAGDLAAARQWQMLSIEIIAIMVRHGGLPAGKAMMNLIGLDCGPVRAPLKTLTGQQQDSLRKELESVGFPARVPQLREIVGSTN